MKIALIGHGKMGQAIERIARSRGHEITAVIDCHNVDDIDKEEFRQADVAIEFTSPQAAADNLRRVIAQGVPVVSGTTGWTDALPLLQKQVEENAGTLLWSSNFSLGVNIFFAINRHVARMMAKFPQYTPSIEEVHHIHKLDHPSGTAKSLAGQIVEESHLIEGWTEDPAAPGNLLPIAHRREGEVPGIHTVSWDSPLDTISLTHTAKSRDSFALGAVLAAEWLPTQRGFVTMDRFMNHLIHDNDK